MAFGWAYVITSAFGSFIASLLNKCEILSHITKDSLFESPQGDLRQESNLANHVVPTCFVGIAIQDPISSH